MKALSGRMTRTTMVVIGLVVGIGLAVLLITNRQAPTHGDSAPPVSRLTVIVAEPVAFQLEARGYGVSRAASSWQASANVPGRVVERHPELESGSLIREGTLLLALDPSRYQLAIAEVNAEKASLSAELAQLDTEEANTKRLLDLEQERLVLSEQELSRIERLSDSGSVSQSRRDEQYRATVAQRQAVAKLENELALIPARRELIDAQLDRAETRLEQANQDLKDTRFKAPYDLRIASVDIDLHQHAAVGQRLFRADSIEAAEIEAHIPFAMMRRLMAGVLDEASPASAMEISERLDFSAISAEARLAAAPTIRWPARVSRVSSGLDPKTRAVRVVVTVDDPYDNVAPPDHPPLQPGMYLQVSLTIMNPSELLVVPAVAVHDGELYLATEDDRLQRQTVTVAFQQNDLAVISQGLEAGDRVIIDDPIPALDGMRIEPRRDKALERRMRARARGEAP